MNVLGTAFLSKSDFLPKPLSGEEEEEGIEAPRFQRDELAQQQEEEKENEAPRFQRNEPASRQIEEKEEVIKAPRFEGEELAQRPEEEEEIEAPRFQTDEPAHRQVEEKEEEIKIPSFLRFDLPELLQYEREWVVGRPKFTPTPIPNLQQNGQDLGVEHPAFASTPNPVPKAAEREQNLIRPDFSHFALPKFEATTETKVDPLELARFRYPIPGKIPVPSVEMPSFSTYQKPHPIAENSSQHCDLPAFDKFPLPEAHKDLPFPSVASPSPMFVDHPTLEAFRQLAKKNSYKKICLLARQHGTQGDMRMLKRDPQHCLNYLKVVFDAFIEDASMLLPRWPTFNILLENDQLQIYLLSRFCKDLVEINKIEELEKIVKLDPAEGEDGFFIHYLTECDVESNVDHEKRLLQFKWSVYSFLSVLLKQENEASRAFGATLKDLAPFSESLRLLADHIQDKSEKLRMRAIYAAEQLDFSLWEDRKVVPAADVKMDPPDLGNLVTDPPSVALSKGLKAIQNDPKKVT